MFKPWDPSNQFQVAFCSNLSYKFVKNDGKSISNRIWTCSSNVIICVDLRMLCVANFRHVFLCVFLAKHHTKIGHTLPGFVCDLSEKLAEDKGALPKARHM
jgi:hypothetical protein